MNCMHQTCVKLHLKNRNAGVSPPALPQVLRDSLYKYLVPRLMALAPLSETIPGVPGLDYPIMGLVPYTNFYCSNMPWPGFYADTEARCQVFNVLQKYINIISDNFIFRYK